MGVEEIEEVKKISAIETYEGYLKRRILPSADYYASNALFKEKMKVAIEKEKTQPQPQDPDRLSTTVICKIRP